ncbi:hypothetical protein NDU88_010854 [Pleurodeles waltl]|uniref:Uncharacterized protein n=1 Tax=Pleurodeles waltl TaxID=8319 RepID=A0AAV7QVW4_PLEWA|nr:hypothetical protein NDU88_010854 [Pleurodeles waltl]
MAGAGRNALLALRPRDVARARRGPSASVGTVGLILLWIQPPGVLFRLGPFSLPSSCRSTFFLPSPVSSCFPGPKTSGHLPRPRRSEPTTGSGSAPCGSLFIQFSLPLRASHTYTAESGPPRAPPQPLVQSQPSPPGPGSRHAAPALPALIPPLRTAAPAGRLLTEARPGVTITSPRSVRIEKPLRIPGRLFTLPDLRADTQRGPGRQELSSVVPTTISFRLTGGPGSEVQGRRPRRHPQSGRISGGAPHLGFGRAPQSRPPS